MKKVSELKKDLRGVTCLETKKLFRLLKNSGKKPYLVSRGDGKYGVRVMFNRKYFIIHADTKLFSMELTRGTRKWLNYSVIDDVVEASIPQSEKAPSEKQIKYISYICDQIIQQGGSKPRVKPPKTGADASLVIQSLKNDWESAIQDTMK